MTRRLLLKIGALFIVLSSFSQADTTIVKSQSGFLFLSAHNYMYDYRPGDHSRPLGFHDFFFLGDTVNFSSLDILDTSINIRGGLRVEYFSLREQYKYKALTIPCLDTSLCYLYQQFYVVPVLISYRIYEDNFPFECRRNFFELKVGRSKLRFEYLHKAIEIVRINETVRLKKK